MTGHRDSRLGQKVDTTAAQELETAAAQELETAGLLTINQVQVSAGLLTGTQEGVSARPPQKNWKLAGRWLTDTGAGACWMFTGLWLANSGQVNTGLAGS